MTPSETADSRLAHLQNNLCASTVYGDPITREEKTVIPVAKVRYMFGTSFGGESTTDEQTDVSSGGAGGGGTATPIGVVEVTDSETRFIRFRRRRREIALTVCGILTGILLRRWL